MMSHTWVCLLLVILSTLVLGDFDEDIIAEFEIEADGSQTILPQKPQETEYNPTQHPSAIGIKIKNPRNYKVDYYWWNNDLKKGVYQGFIMPKSVTATNSYIGHIFYFTEQRNPTEFHRILVKENTNLYILPPLDVNDEHYLKLLEEKSFTEQYFKDNGVPWLAHYPRDPPIHWMWAADYIGQIHTIETNETYWNCIPNDIYINMQDTNEINKCRSTAISLTLELEVISLQPRAFRITNSLSAAEADIIVRLADRKLKRSRAGQHGGLESNTRTSSNAWLGRHEHIMLDTIYRRTAHIVNIDEKLLTPGNAGNIVEDMQVVYYEIGQEYTAHHDFGATDRPNQRYITLLFYLNNQLHENAGGETNFPKGNGGRGMKVHPGKGSSIMFYSILPDGNADDKSLHAALPIKDGIKWLANFWIWDPER